MSIFSEAVPVIIIPAFTCNQPGNKEVTFLVDASIFSYFVKKAL